MSRVAGVVVPGLPHHVTQRGNRRADVFETDGDREAYLRYLRAYGEKRGSAAFVERLESLVGRQLRPQPRGPQRGTKYRKRKVT